MVGMTLLLVVVGIVVLGAVGTGVRRRLVDERSSVRDYQQTLDTLRHLSERRAPAGEQAHPQKMTAPPPAARKERPSSMLASSRRSTGRSRRPAAMAARSATPAVSRRVEGPPARAAKQRPAKPPETATEVVAAVEAPAKSAAAPAHQAAAATATQTAVEAPAPARAAQAVRELIAHPELHGPTRSRSMPGSRRQPRRMTPMAWTVAAAVGIAVVTGVALTMGPSHPSHTSAPPVSVTPPVKHLAATRPTSSHRAATPPAPASLDPVTSSASSATYDLPPSSSALTLTASGPCWVQATVPSTGQVLWTGTLQSGQSQTIPPAPGVLLRLGNANNVQVTVGSAPVHLPNGFALVFAMTFLPA